MNNKVKNHSVISPPPPPPPPRVQLDYSSLLLHLFLGVVLLLSFSRCGGGGDTPEPTSQPETTTTINPETPNPVVKSKEASISKISFTVNAKNYDASIVEETVTVMLPYGTTIPSEVTITTLEHSSKADPSVKQGETLTVSNGKATITVTAEDQTTTMTYSINFLTELGVKVTFNVNDDITTIPPLDVKKGSKASRPATDPMPASGKSFGYWTAVMGSTPASYGKDLFDFDTTPINEDITLYAVWQEKPETKAALITLINQAIDDQGDTPNLNFIDTGLITDMSRLFKSKSAFNGDISGWDTSQVTNMDSMFNNARAFNGDIGDWDTSKVTNMKEMFSGAHAFNGDIGDWDTSKVTNMDSMFLFADAFNGEIGDWDTSKVTDMEGMFFSTDRFNKDIEDWDTSQVTTMKNMFKGARDFDQDISGWIVAQVTDYTDIFKNCGIREEYKPLRFRTNNGN